MYKCGQVRKKLLPEYDLCRLLSAADNRPMKGAEFWEKAR